MSAIQPPNLSAEEVEKWMDDMSASDEATNLPKSPTKVTMSTSELAVLRAPMWVAEHHEDDWAATVGSDQAVIEDCCTDGAATLSEMNPDSFQMPLGTRVVCIKTQHLNNLHIAMQRGVWTTGDKVGEKINRVFEGHDREGVEKVLFIFSINRQRAFCALAEMDGLWVKEENHLPGWQEAAGSFNTVGSIPVTFTHVKNVANDHFDQIHHENPNQPITNMWNGMHFQPDKGREVVKIFHEKPHFTNVLCRDKRKRYSPFDAVTSTQDIDPTITRKYSLPSHRFGSRGRGGRMPHAITNWRTDMTPTRAQHLKRIEAKAEDDPKTPTPRQPRSMRRDHAPTPPLLRTPAGPPQLSPSPRPGQITKCVVDSNGNYVPIGPFEDSPSASGPTAHELSAPKPMSLRRGENEQNRSSWRHKADQSFENNTTGGYGGMHDSFVENLQQHQPNLQPKASLPRLLADKSDLASSQESLPSAKLSQDLAGEHKSAQSDGATSTDLLRRAAMQSKHFIPHFKLPQKFDAGNTSVLLAAKCHFSAQNPRNIARHAYERNEKLLSYESIRRQQSSAEGSAASTLASEYQDWASTSEIERMRVAPVSPLTDSDPFVVDSISKSGSPTTKAFKASVNRKLRTMRQGQRAMPTPSKFKFNPAALNTAQGHGAPSPQSSDYPSRPTRAAGHGGSMDGGVPLPLHAMQPQSNMGDDEALFQHPRRVHHSRGLSTLSGAGQLPRSMITDMVSAGQYASVDQNARFTTHPQAFQASGMVSDEQPQPRFRAKRNADDDVLLGARSNDRSDPPRFTP